MRKINPKMKINIIITMSVVACAIFWFFFYLPSQKRIKELKNKFEVVEGQIHSIEGKINRNGKMARGIVLLEKRYRELSSKFPEKEEQALEMISGLGREFQIEITSIRSQSRTFFLDEEAKKVSLEGKFCQEFPVSIKVKASYKNLVEYIDSLREQLPAYVTVESIHLYKGASGSLKLTGELDLILYLLS